jgi:ParB family chromosome partitioning protein
MGSRDALKAKSGRLAALMVPAVFKSPKSDVLRDPMVGIGPVQPDLIGIDDVPAVLDASSGTKEIRPIALEAIGLNPWQPRKVFRESEIQTLADSIAASGLIQPIVVRRRVTPGDTLYQLVAGERRLRAHKLLGLQEIDAYISEVTDEEMAVTALSENIHRQDLSDYEVSLAIERAEKEFPNRKRMAEALGMARPELYRYLAFSQLPDFLRSDLDTQPRLLSRKSAEALRAVLIGQGSVGIEALRTLWPKVVAGDLGHPRLAEAVKKAVLQGKVSGTNGSTQVLYIGKERAGSVIRDALWLTIRIRRAALIGDQEERLGKFVEALLKGP